MSSGVSEQEIERELQTLRNLRRRSISSPGPGALAVDPDLPPPSPGSASPNSPTYTSNDDITLSTPDGLDDGGLFWVPAHLHPELAPGEFRNFLKQHTHADPEHATSEDAGETPGVSRSGSWLARSNSRKDSLGRKRSMLSKQYHPKAGDHVEEDRPPMPTTRVRGSIYGGKSGEKGLTLHDLQQLEAIVDQADEEGDPDAARAMLRRTLSTNRSPGFLHEGEEGGDSSSLTRPQSILRRSARTRIRKANLPGDGGGHRFASTRKGRTTAAPDIDIPEDNWDGRKYSTGTSDESAEYDSLDHATRESGDTIDEDGNRYYDAPQHLEERRGSDSTDDMGIFDAYRQSRSSSTSSEDNSYEGTPSSEGSPPDKVIGLPQIPRVTRPDSHDWFAEEGEKTPTQERVSDPFGGSMRRTESGPGLSLQLPSEPQTPDSRSPTSPTTPQQRPLALPTSDLPPGMAAPRLSLQSQGSKENVSMTPVNLETPRPALNRVDSHAAQEREREKEKEKEKEKKGGFFSKKDKSKDKDKSKKEKDSLFGSLFGGKKKVEEPASVSNFSSTDGRAAAAALLGTSKSAKSIGLHGHTTPSPTSSGFVNNYARYPIHVERAIYRLSHIKLANARRPLFEQVLISNLMFWYLGIIGRNVDQEKKAGSTNGKEAKEGKEGKESGGGGEDKEQKMVAKGTPIKPADSGSAGVPLPRPPPQQRKIGLSKPERSRSGRDHEAPIKAPSYGSQNAQVDHEVRSATAQVQGLSIKSRNTPPPRDYVPPQQFQPAPPQHHQQQQQQQQQAPPHPQHPQHPQHSQHTQHTQHPQHSQAPPPHMQGSSQQARSASQPGPQRALSPPAANHSRPASETYQSVPPQQGHSPPPPIFQAPPRGVPQSSFGPPPPPVNGHLPGQAPGGPAPPFDDRRQRTMSQPGHPPPQQMGPPPANMRRVVTDGRPPPQNNPYSEGVRLQEHRLPQHGGPQPGQLFQYPGASGPTSPVPGRPPPPGSPFTQRPGQGPGPPHSPQPGQVFHHQQQQQPPQSRYSPQPGQPNGPPPGWQQQQQQQSQRLPPGAQHPQYAHPDAHLQRQLSHPPQNRPPMPYPPQQQPPYQQHPHARPPPQGYYPQQPGQAPQQRPPGPGGPAVQPGQVYSPPAPGYGPGPQQDGFRRAQPVPPAQYAPQHR